VSAAGRLWRGRTEFLTDALEIDRIMSILDEIARRRRASALRRLGPPQGALPQHYPTPGQRRPLAPQRQLGAGGGVTTLERPAASSAPVAAPPPPAPQIAVERPEIALPAARIPAPEPVVLAEPVLEPEPEFVVVPEPVLKPEPAPVVVPTPEPAARVEPVPMPVITPVPEPQFQPEAATADFPRIAEGPAPRVADRPRYESWLPAPDLFRLTTESATSTELVPVTRPVQKTDLQRILALPGFLARTQMRRRIRYLRHLREVQLRDLGGFALELHRFGRDRPEIVEAKLESAAQTDRELRQLELVLTGKIALREVREPGIGGVCDHCGAVHGSEDRFCSNCGEPLAGTAVLSDDGRA
jgi:hypothetical protein